jgi:hypothetical protein
VQEVPGSNPGGPTIRLKAYSQQSVIPSPIERLLYTESNAHPGTATLSLREPRQKLPEKREKLVARRLNSLARAPGAPLCLMLLCAATAIVISKNLLEILVCPPFATAGLALAWRKISRRNVNPLGNVAAQGATPKNAS